jgi:hypothetical protein
MACPRKAKEHVPQLPLFLGLSILTTTHASETSQESIATSRQLHAPLTGAHMLVRTAARNHPSISLPVVLGSYIRLLATPQLTRNIIPPPPIQRICKATPRAARDPFAEYMVSLVTAAEGMQHQPPYCHNNSAQPTHCRNCVSAAAGNTVCPTAAGTAASTCPPTPHYHTTTQHTTRWVTPWVLLLFRRVEA